MPAFPDTARQPGGLLSTYCKRHEIGQVLDTYFEFKYSYEWDTAANGYHVLIYTWEPRNPIK